MNYCLLTCLAWLLIVSIIGLCCGAILISQLIRSILIFRPLNLGGDDGLGAGPADGHPVDGAAPHQLPDDLAVLGGQRGLPGVGRLPDGGQRRRRLHRREDDSSVRRSDKKVRGELA